MKRKETTGSSVLNIVVLYTVYNLIFGTELQVLHYNVKIQRKQDQAKQNLHPYRDLVKFATKPTFKAERTKFRLCPFQHI